MNHFLGNEQIHQVFSSLITENRLHHCYLLEGPTGVGKQTFAQVLVKRMSCMSEELEAYSLRACQKCWSCQMIDTNSHPDIMHIGLDPERTAPIISVRQAREVIERIDAPPFRAKRRFVIIDPADAMRDEAANALLKTFEEPPEHTNFILITQSAHRLLPTIRSRSQRVRFRPCHEHILSNWLEEQGCEDAQLVSRLSNGCPGAAIRLMDGEIETWLQTRQDILLTIKATAEERYRYSSSLTKGKRELWAPVVSQVLEVLQSICRDLLCVYSGREEQLINIDCLQDLLGWGESITPEQVYQLYNRVESVRNDLELYVNARLLLDALLSEFSAAWRAYAH